MKYKINISGLALSLVLVQFCATDTYGAAPATPPAAAPNPAAPDPTASGAPVATPAPTPGATAASGGSPVTTPSGSPDAPSSSPDASSSTQGTSSYIQDILPVELVQALVKVMNQRNLREYRELIARKDGRGETWLAYGNLKYETPGADSTQSSKTPLAIGCIARTFYPTNPGHADGVRRLLARQLEVDPSAPGVARLKSALEVTGLLVETCGHLAAGKPLKEDIIAWLGRIVQIIALPGTGRILVDIDTVSAGQADKLMQPIIKSTKDPAVKESASRYNAAWKDYEKQYPPL